MFDLSQSATSGDIKISYRKLVWRWHPDRFPDDPGMHLIAEERIKEINIAYDFLCRHFSRKRNFETRDESDSDASQKVEPIVFNCLDNGQFVINLQQERVFPILFQVFSDSGFRNIAWNTYKHVFQAKYFPPPPAPAQEMELETSLFEQSDKTNIKFSFKFSHHADNVKLGFVEGPDITPAIRGLLNSRAFNEQIRPNLLQTYYQSFQLHEITFSELKNKKVLSHHQGDLFEFQGITINQLLNILYKSFLDNGVKKIFWNIKDKIIFGTSGWSLRSCGQYLGATIKGTSNQFSVRIHSYPLSAGGQPNAALSDFGRGSEDIGKIRNHILKQVTT